MNTHITKHEIQITNSEECSILLRIKDISFFPALKLAKLKKKKQRNLKNRHTPWSLVLELEI
jgi:hypothetical protein